MTMERFWKVVSSPCHNDPLTFQEVKLWYATKLYNVLLGTVITIWTTHIHPTASSLNVLGSPTTNPATILTSIFPERDNGCYISIHPNEEGETISNYTILEYANSQNISGLMSLEKLANRGGDECPDAKVLVCVVAVGQPTNSKPSISLSNQF
jgi:hypothetical protein